MLPRVGVVLTPLLIALVFPGCRSIWREPRSLPLIATYDPPWRRSSVDANRSGQEWTANFPDSACSPDAALQTARDFAADATRAELTGSDEAAGDHYRAALASWTALNQSAPGAAEFQQARETYHTSVARLLATARDEGQFIPGQGLVVDAAGVQAFIPLAVHTSVWRADDVQVLHPVGEYRAPALSRQYRQEGWGVPLVVERRQPTGTRCEEDFLQPGTMFAATALLRPYPSGSGAVLELYDPLHPDAAATSPVGPLAYDLSAPFALRVISSPSVARDWLSFFGVDMPTREGLFFIEPYQPGKIPVVLVHGILSNPIAWVDLANDLRATPGFAERFQLWAFRYATGDPFLESASLLRHDLDRAAATIDPVGQDPALSQMVLVGHSMGGLICELQAASSGDRLWNSISNRPLSAIVATAETRQALQDMFYFAPQSNVRRVICLAAPHQGSNWARRPVGRLGSLLAVTEPARVARHEQLMRDNPGVFSSEVARRVPTSVDMLKPESAVLQALASLPTDPCVRFHTVFGYGRANLAEGPGDGVVSINSALSPRAVSQVGVESSHTTIHRKLESADEIVRILNEHLTEYAACRAAVACPGAETEAWLSAPR